MELTKSFKIMCILQDKKESDVADSLGVTRVWLWRELKNNSPKYISKLANHFNITVAEFINKGMGK